MAQQERKFNPAREAGAENRKDASTRPREEMEREVAQRATPPDDTSSKARGSDDRTSAAAGAGDTKTSGYGNREDRENPAKGLQQSGLNQDHELPGQGTRVGDGERRESRAMSQNGSRISDFEGRHSSR